VVDLITFFSYCEIRQDVDGQWQLAFELFGRGQLVEFVLQALPELGLWDVEVAPELAHDGELRHVFA
jgi:hypothetical protein